jgi:hypothetical protein
MQSSRMWHNVTLLRVDVSEELIASIIRVKRIRQIVNPNIVPRSLILSNQMMEAIRTSETSFLT